MADTTLPQEIQSEPNPSLARNAGLISLGNVASRVLGLLREMVIATWFGATGEVSAFRVASLAPTIVYDFLIGGMLSAALVPTLSEYIQPARRGEFVRVISMVISLFVVLLALLLLVLELLAPQVATLMASGFDKWDPTLLPLTVRMIRLILPAIWFFGMAGVLTGILYALQRFTFPALSSAVYNLGIIVAAPLLAGRFGVTSLVVGILLGSLAQFAMMAWDLRHWLRTVGHAMRFQFDWHHPALRKIVVLYIPIAGIELVSSFQVGLDRRLASGSGERSIAWMQNATTLQQLPLGLISVAIALAALPRLSQHFANHNEAAYRATLGRGLRTVLLLIAPAAVGLYLLGEPITRLIFEHGLFLPTDTAQVVSALHIYLVGMLFAAIDFPLNYAFYARNNTLGPALVGVLSVGVYVVVAFALLDSLGYHGLIWADSAKQASHALVMLLLLTWRVGRLNARTLTSGLAILAAAVGMAASLYVVRLFLQPQLPPNLLGDLLNLAISGSVGVLVYAFLLQQLGVRELQDVVRMVVARLR
ncbi:MAG: murein biosynthesis integral membrane protein MurJ [Caldilineaceae bacterium]|nr:murein biosynthesis integral membrane protein MurJ [Caldilineaceae bacterium]